LINAKSTPGQPLVRGIRLPLGFGEHIGHRGEGGSDAR
jgi:hypothetical protein